MKHDGYNTLAGNPAYDYQYKGKELQKEIGWSDCGARMYCRRLEDGESQIRWQKHHYGNNNPVRFTDPDGRQSWDNLTTYNPGSAVTSFMNRNGFGGENLPMFYNDDAGIMIMNQALGNDGEGGGSSTTIGNIKGFGVELGSLDSFMQMSFVLNLRQQLINAAMNPDAKANYKDLGKLLMGVSSLTELYKITETEFTEDSNLNSPRGNKF